MKLRFGIPLLILAGFALAGATCRHEVAVTEPIKIEVTIRQEIHEYVHQVNDVVAGKGSVDDFVDSILAESESETETETGGGSSLLRRIERLFVNVAYAAGEDTRAKLKAAIEGRKARYAAVQQFLRDGSLGENHMALLSFRETQKTKTDARYAQAVRLTISKENADRETIIAIIAAQKGVAVSIVREEQFKANVTAAPAGAWIEVKQGDKWVWSHK